MSNRPGIPLFLVSLCSLALSGCISFKDILPQTKAVDAAHLDTGAAIKQASHMEWPNDSWWTAYQDPQLNDWVARCLHSNPDLKKAQARISLSNAFAEQMHAATLPSLAGKASTGRERFTELSFIPPPWAGRFNWNNQATLNLSYDLDLWQQKKSLWLAALDESKVSTAEMQQVKIELTTALIRSYVRLAAEYQLRDIAETALQDLSHEISITRRALKAGLGTQLELSTLETRLPAAQNRIEQRTLQITLLQHQIAALAGEGPGAGEQIQRPKISLTFQIGLPETLPANLVGRRPDIMAARWRVEASDLYIQSAKADFYPNINLLSFAGFQALAFSQLFSSAGFVGGFGPALSLPIFDGGKRRANLTAQTAAYDMAVEAYNATVLQALEGISGQLATLISNARETQNTQQALQQAEQAYQLANRHYRAGLSNYQESLHTHALLLQQQELLLLQEATRQDTYAHLMLALGGGVMTVPTPTTTDKRAP